MAIPNKLYIALCCLTALLFFILAIIISSPCYSTPITVIDDQGYTVHLQKPATRIISLAPHLTELLFTLDAQANLIGVVEYSDYPADAQHIRRIGNAMTLDFESILALKPDLIVAWQTGNGERNLHALNQLGLTIYRSEPTALAHIPKNILDLGNLTGHRSLAHQQSLAFSQQLTRIRQQYQACTISPITIFYQLWNQPMITIGNHSLLNQVFATCSAQSIFKDLPDNAPKVSLEAVLQANPEVIITSHPDWEANWYHWPSLTASQQKRIFYIHPDYLQRPTLRILEGIKQLCRHLHPDCNH